MSAVNARGVREQVERRFRPTVLVLSTDGAEGACRKNNINLIDLLKPFTSLPRDVHTKTTGEPYPLTSFGIRLTDFSGLASIGEEKKVEWFTKLAREDLDFRSSEDKRKMQDWESDVAYLAGQSDPSRPDIKPEQMAKIISELSSPLFTRFRTEYTDSCRFTEFDTFDHPVACILAVSSNSPDAIAELKGLFTAHQPSFSNHAVDHNQTLFYVLVQDMSTPCKQSEVDKVFADMKAQFGSQTCRLLQINSNQADEPQVDPRKWDQPVTIDDQTAAPREGLVQHMSKNDEVNISKMMSTFIETALLPDLTRRIKTLNQSVADKRQGKIGKMMSYWLGNKNNDSSSKAPKQGPSFGPDSCEMQLRKLADLCFMLHDYDTALSVYKMLKSELGSQESKNLHTYHAAVAEGMGMCMALQQKRDADTQLEQAAQLYQRGKRTDYALRTRLFQYTLSKTARSYRAADIMKLASTIDDRKTLYCGMFIEEAGMSYLYSNYGGLTTTRLRKFAFSVTLAGCRYSSCECPDQALRVTAMAAAVYSRMNLEKWRQINEHIQLTLARLWQQKGELGNAVAHMGNYLIKVQRTTDKMVKEYNGYLQTHLESVSDRVYDELPLPFVNMLSIKLNPMPQAELWHSPDAPPETPLPAWCKLDTTGVAKEWVKMEGDVINSARSEFKNLKLHPQIERARRIRKMKTVDMAQHPIVIVQGEEVSATIDVTNPLALPLMLHHAVILYEVTAEQPNQLASINPPAGEVLKGVPVSDITIAASSSVPLRLPFVSPSGGWVRLVGVEWSVATEKLQPTSGRYMFYKGAVDNGEVGMAAVQQLTVQCTQSAPLMKIEIKDAPPLCMMHGEVTKSTLRIHNIGGLGMQQITLKLSQANAHLVCIPLPEGGKQQMCEDTEGVYDTYYLPNNVPSGEVLELPIWIRAESGNNSKAVATNYIPIVLCYGDDTPVPVRRVSKMVIRTVVQPSLSLRALCLPPSCVRPEAEDESQFIVTLEMRSLRQRKTGNPETAIALQQVSVLSCDWDVEPLDPDAVQMPFNVTSGSAFAVSFRARRRANRRQEAATCFTDPSCSSYKPDQLPFDYFAINSSKDLESGTGGSGHVGTTVVKRGGGMQMFLDRKEKKKAASAFDNTDFPLCFSLFWSALGYESGTAVPFTGQAIACCQPCNTTVKTNHTWQDAAGGVKNLLRTRGINTVGAEPQPTTVGKARAEHNIIGVSLSFPSEVRHDFRSNAPCLTPVTITLTNYYNSPREVWVHFVNNKTVHRTQTQQVTTEAPTSAALPSLVKGAPQQQQSQAVKIEVPFTQYPTFHWQGKSKHKVLLGCYESATIVARAQFLRPGVFSLNQFDISPVQEDTSLEIQGGRHCSDTMWLVRVVHDDKVMAADVAHVEVEEGHVVHADVYEEVDVNEECEEDEDVEEVFLDNSRSGAQDESPQGEEVSIDGTQGEEQEEADTRAEDEVNPEAEKTESEEAVREVACEGEAGAETEAATEAEAAEAEAEAEVDVEAEVPSPEPAAFDEASSADRSPSPED